MSFSLDEDNEISSYEILFKSYYSKVYKVAYYFMKNEHDAKDIVQEAFIRAFDNIGTLRDKSKFEVWVCTIATNIAKSKLISTKKEILIDDDKKIITLIDIKDFKLTEDIVEEKEMQKYILNIISNLDENHKQVIIMYYYLGLSYEEISSLLGINIGTVRSRLSRAKEKLKNRIPHNYFNLKEGMKCETQRTSR